MERYAKRGVQERKTGLDTASIVRDVRFADISGVGLTDAGLCETIRPKAAGGAA